MSKCMLSEYFAWKRNSFKALEPRQSDFSARSAGPSGALDIMQGL
jgi:hypothetical protein